MNETIKSISISNRKNKKYKAIVQNKITKKERTIHFGSSLYEQYKDSTPVGAYSSKNHFDKKRRNNYFKRHSGVTSKTAALKKEKLKSNGNYNPKILSHQYLW